MMDGQELLRQGLIHADRLDRHSRGMETGIAGLRIFRSPRPTKIKHELLGPVCCLVLQGEKPVRHEGAAHVVGPMHSFFVPVDLPLLSRIKQARLVALIGQPLPARKVLQPLIRRELHFWPIASSHSAALRGLLRPGGAAERIAHAVRAIRGACAAPLAVEALAKGAGMSASGFHAQFRAVTGTTPLQLQKSLRLIDARRLLQTDGNSVSAAAFAVGYESPTQFSREFSRRFGLARSEVLRPTLRLSPRLSLRPALRQAA